MEQNGIKDLTTALSEAFQRPVEIASFEDLSRVALPPGWTLQERDNIKYQYQPRRTTGSIKLDEIDSFIDYINRHKIPACTSIYCLADYEKGDIGFDAIINDNQGGADMPHWRDHIVTYHPAKSFEWKRWSNKHKQPMSQIEFAMFLEENLRDIASVDSMPTGQQLLEMALSFEANQDMRFKSAMRLQNGGVQMSLVQDDDAQTIAKMQMFDKISIGIPVFWNGAAYRVDARLRYRVRDGKLTFWYELIRPDRVIEDAAKQLISTIREKTGVFFYFGNPGLI